MAFDPNVPALGAKLDPAVMRDQFNSLKALIDAQATLINTQQQQLDAKQQQIDAQAGQITALQTQLAAQAALLNQLIIPQLNHDDQGTWSVSIIGTLPALWQVWVRSDLNNDWSNSAAYTPANFPVNDIGLMPPGAQWWQIKVCGSDSSNNPLTPFSNTVSLGPVP